MKKKLSFVLALVMLITAIPLVTFAQNYDKQLEEAIMKSKELFGITEKYDKFDYSVSTYNDKTVFYLNWYDSKNTIGSIDVTMTSDGVVTSYYKWDINSHRDRPMLPKLSKKDGLDIAEKFIEKVSPEFKNKLKYIDNEEPLYVYSEGYNYSFIRVENDIPYYSNGIEVFVDNYSGEVTRYYVNWEMDLKFANTSGILSLDEVSSLYKEKIGLELIYKEKYNTDTMEYYLVYAPLNRNLNVDAKTGEVVSGYEYYGITEDVAKEATDSGAGNLSPAEVSAVEGIKGIMTKDEAEKIARDILEIDDKYSLSYNRLYRDSEGSYYWYLNYTKEDGYAYTTASMSINAVNKEIISFNKYEPVPEDAKPKYNEKESLSIAERFIEKMAKDKKGFIELNETSTMVRPLEDQKSYSFQFIRKLDNAYVQNNGIYIIVDAVNGKVTSYDLSWKEVEFPSQDNVIALDKAYNILFDEIGMELKYIVPYGNDTDRNNRKQEAILVYGLKADKPANIDANTGIILDYSGKPYEEVRIVSYNDIDSSYAKDKIIVLSQFGVALPGEEFRPKDKMIQRDFLYLLAKVDYPYIDIDDAERLYELLINRGIIKDGEKAPEKIITKEEAIKYIIRALNYDKVAGLTGIFKDVFQDSKDISDELKGYVAIAYGLKIVEGSNGNLNPKAEIKREDGANLIYNYIINVK